MASGSSDGPRATVRGGGGDLIIPVLAGAFAVYFLYDTWDLAWEARINGLLIGLPLLSLVALKVSLVLSQALQGRLTLDLGELGARNVNQAKRAALIAIFVGFALLLEHLGTTLCLFLALLLSLLTLGVRRPSLLVFVPVGTSLFVYTLFILFLRKRFPSGPVEWFLDALLHGGGA
jgi:hypothetical protein